MISLTSLGCLNLGGKKSCWCVDILLIQLLEQKKDTNSNQRHLMKHLTPVRHIYCQLLLTCMTNVETPPPLTNMIIDVSTLSRFGLQ